MQIADAILFVYSINISGVEPSTAFSRYLLHSLMFSKFLGHY